MTLLQPDIRVSSRYRLDRRIAVGGMGQVWRAVDEVLGRNVAVKVLNPELAADETFRHRFRDEARHTARLSHPGIAALHDYGEEGVNGVVLAYLVMELVEGESLRTWIGRHGGLGPARTFSVVAQAARALEVAHRAGIVHRDVKPANLLVREDGVLKVTDFGIAHGADSVPLTQTGTVMGTGPYMSPEQRSGRRVGPPSDVFSLGVVAIECLQGVCPPAGTDRASVAAAQLHPPARALVTSMVRPNPASRPSVAAVAEQGEELLARQRRRRPAPSPTGPRADQLTTAMVTPTSTALTPAPPVLVPARRRWPGRRFVVGLVTVVVVLGVAGIVAGFLVGGGSGTARVPSLVGEDGTVALQRLASIGLHSQVRPADGTAPAGRVTAQDPRPGATVARGAVVTLGVGSGYVVIDRASLVGQPAARAEAALATLGLRGTVTSTVSASGTSGTVLSVTPTGRVPLGTAVVLDVVQAPPTTTATTPPPPAPTPAGAKPPSPAPGPGGPHGHGNGNGNGNKDG